MKNIDEIVRKNRGVFNDEEPSEGHLERFSALLEKRFGVKKKINIGPYLLRAAVVTILVTLSSLWTWDNFIRPESGPMTLSDISPQYREVEQYYIQQVSLMENEIIEIDLTTDSDHKKMLEEELENMDASYAELQKELKANPGDERIINAMIDHYQTRVEVMNYILNQLREMQKQNQITESHESITI
jgi:hypothetical protein